MITFIKNENSPSVIILRGSEIILSIGFKNLKAKARNIPPIMKVA